jgi:hypothetical protein
LLGLADPLADTRLPEQGQTADLLSVRLDPPRDAQAPTGSAQARRRPCTSPFTIPTRFCNLGISYDFNPGLAGDQDGLLPAGSPLLSQCFADWGGLQGNPASASQIFDITDNLREIVKVGTNQYNLMGGAFNSQSDEGATCDFTFYAVDQNFKFFDTGFRCCFTQDPTL